MAEKEGSKKRTTRGAGGGESLGAPGKADSCISKRAKPDRVSSDLLGIEMKEDEHLRKITPPRRKRVVHLRFASMHICA